MSETKRKKAVIYCRVSTKEQADEGGSLATQEKICKDYALKNGYEIIATFIEHGESAKNADRTELQHLLSFCTEKKNRAQAVIAYKVDRIARNIDDYRYIRVLLKGYGVEIKSTSEYFEDTPAGRFMENIIANVAQFDNDVRTERCVNGSRDAMREGRYVWHAPFGYSNQKLGNKSTIVPNNKADIVRRVFEEIAKDYCPVDTVRHKMFKEGLTTASGKIFTKSCYYRMLGNEVYKGWIVKFGERHKGLFEPIVSEDLFKQVQRILKRRSHQSFIYRHEHPDFPLRRFVLHENGTRITGSWSKGRKKKYAYYRFIGISKTDYRKDEFESKYAAFVNKYTLDPQDFERFKAALLVAYDAANKKNFKDAERQRAYLLELDERQTSLIVKNQKGVISDDVLKRQLEQIEEEIIKAQAELYRLPRKEEDIGGLMDFVAGYLTEPGKVWLNSPYEIKLGLQWFEFPRGVILHNGKFRTNKVASIFKVKDDFLSALSLNVDLKGRIFEHGTNNNLPHNHIPIEILRQYAAEIKRLSDILTGKPPDKEEPF